MEATAPSRVVALDFVRGIAILGILLLNIVGFAWPEIVYVSPRAPTAPVTPADDWTWLAIFVLADGKFRGLFTLLFGASMLLFVERADGTGRDGAALQRRRLGWLALFGLAHFFLIWWGDILFLYAVCGFVALGARDWPVRQLWTVALGIYALGAATMGVLTAGQAFDPVQAAQLFADYARQSAGETAAMQSSWPGLVGWTLRESWSDPLTTVAMTWFETIPLMLIGMALFRSGFFATWERGQLVRWAAWGIAAGLVLTLPLAWWIASNEFALAFTLFVWLGPAALVRLASVIGYAALFVILAKGCSRSFLGERLVACGRMAFSNYIGTSLLMTFIFHGWGLGLFARYGRFELLGFVLPAWALMLAWSKPWLANFRYGPLEWLWRSLTYGTLAPLRK